MKASSCRIFFQTIETIRSNIHYNIQDHVGDLQAGEHLGVLGQLVLLPGVPAGDGQLPLVTGEEPLLSGLDCEEVSARLVSGFVTISSKNITQNIN